MHAATRRHCATATGCWCGTWAVTASNQSSIEKPAVTGRFVLLRESDGLAFLATTRLTDTW